MRILHESHIPIECPSCNAVLAVEFKDVVYDDTGHSIPYSCKCMSCGSRIPLKKQVIPNRWIVKWDDVYNG